MRKTTWLLATLTIAALISGAGYWGAHQYVRSKLLEKLPGATYQHMRLAWGEVQLEGLRFSKGWVQGDLDRVVIRDSVVTVQGGRVRVTVTDTHSKETRDTNSSGMSLRASDLEVHADLPRGLTGDFHECSWDGTQAKFETGTLYKGKLEAALSRGAFSPKTEQVTVHLATTNITPKKVALLDLGTLPIRAENVTLDLRKDSVEAEFLQAGPFSANQVQYSINGGRFTIFTQLTRSSFEWLYETPLAFPSLSVSVGSSALDDVMVAFGRAPGGVVVLAYENGQLQGTDACQNWLEAIPSEMRVPPLDRLTLKGDLSFSVKFDPPRFKLKARCRATCSTLPDLRHPFTYLAYYGTERKERKSGPGSAEWVPVALMGSLPEYAVLFEDPGFPRHTGVIAQAFENSFVDNLKLGEFHRGGSTITMQLAKNLWLSRDKTLGRKIQELFLAQALESCYSKDEIVELYLNVVEFGPSIYGAQAGTRHWFEKETMQLDPVEAFWLASILPRPRTARKPADFGQTRKLMERLTGTSFPEPSEDAAVDLSEWVAQ